MKFRTIGQEREVTVITLRDKTELIIIDERCIAAMVKGRKMRTDKPESLLKWVLYDREPTKPQSFFDTLLNEA